MNGIVSITFWRFLLIYLLLLLVLFIMKKSRIENTGILFTAGLRMTLQLVLAGYVLTFIFQNPHPLLTLAYLFSMTGFAIHRVLSGNRDLNLRFRLSIAGSLALSGVVIVFFFVWVVVNVSIFNPQYVIPLSGMIFGNAMTGVGLAVKTFRENLRTQRPRIDALLNVGAPPKEILLPFVNQSLETALLPTLNSMLGMGIVSLPGMMTGQMLSGTLPTTAIFYQISIMIAICAVVCLAVYGSLQLGYQTLINKDDQIVC
ncbi:MAG: ABC transporter permease [Pygmaiobacter sp.]|nr:ABC transporter permease [Pygmaiobacter sp.]